jgi:NAD(P)-dependent dehydrogenase (short-subunit alcohol dehydrogenase family)
MIDPSHILLKDKVAFITGGASGIGKGIALGLAAFGANIAIADKDVAAGQATTCEIAALGRTCRFFPLEMMNGDDVRSAIEGAYQAFGRLDILVNNVGGVRHQRFLDMSPRSIDRHVALNMTTMFIATAAAAPLIAASGQGGSILNITSSEGLRAGPLVAVYAACKAAMVSFTKSMALELAEQGIRVNAIAPDQCVTEGVLLRRPGALPEGFLPHDHPGRKRYVPLNRMGTVDDSAGAAVFLASNLASYITGETLCVDGGTIAASGWNRDAQGHWTLYMRD